MRSLVNPGLDLCTPGGIAKTSFGDWFSLRGATLWPPNVFPAGFMLGLQPETKRHCGSKEQ
jgi:hypothetical protein